MLNPCNMEQKHFDRNRATYIGVDRCSAMDTEVSAPRANAAMPESCCNDYAIPFFPHLFSL